MNSSIIDEIVSCMAIHGEDSSIQRVQTAHRLKLAEFWGIQEGDRILEIGCGQGDTTAVLAYFAGESGFVHGVDIAPPTYGYPITVAEAAEHLKGSKIGKKIQIDFEVDVLSSEIDFPEQSFDVIVLSHCSWYFASAQQLTAVLQKARKWGKKLYFAEWDARVSLLEQYTHFLAALIQAQYEAFKENSLANIRTLFTPDDIKTIAEQAGWNVTAEDSLYSPELQDGQWEVGYTLHEYTAELEAIPHVPLKFTTLIQSQINLLKSAKQTGGIKPMSTFVFAAE